MKKTIEVPIADADAFVTEQAIRIAHEMQQVLVHKPIVSGVIATAILLHILIYGQAKDAEPFIAQFLELYAEEQARKRGRRDPVLRLDASTRVH